MNLPIFVLSVLVFVRCSLCCDDCVQEFTAWVDEPKSGLIAECKAEDNTDTPEQLCEDSETTHHEDGWGPMCDALGSYSCDTLVSTKVADDFTACCATECPEPTTAPTTAPTTKPTTAPTSTPEPSPAEQRMRRGSDPNQCCADCIDKFSTTESDSAFPLGASG